MSRTNMQRKIEQATRKIPKRADRGRGLRYITGVCHLFCTHHWCCYRIWILPWSYIWITSISGSWVIKWHFTQLKAFHTGQWNDGVNYEKPPPMTPQRSSESLWLSYSHNKRKSEHQNVFLQVSEKARRQKYILDIFLSHLLSMAWKPDTSCAKAECVRERDCPIIICLSTCTENPLPDHASVEYGVSIQPTQFPCHILAASS